MSTPTDIVAMEVDTDALPAGWVTVLDRLVSDEQLFSNRMVNYQRCADLGAPGPGGTWSEEVLEKILAAVRSRGVSWAVRPPLEQRPTSFLSPAVLTDAEEKEEFKWVWAELPIPWVCKTEEHRTFPLPLAKLSSDAASHALLVNVTALWHLIPSESLAADFFRPKALFWEFANSLGMAPDDHLVPGNRSKAQREKVGGSATPSPGTLAARMSFAAYMSSLPLVLAAMFWMAGVAKQDMDVQKAVLAILKYVAKIGSFSVVLGVLVQVGDSGERFVDGDQLRGWLDSTGLRSVWSRAQKAGLVGTYETPTVYLWQMLWFVARHVWLKRDDAVGHIDIIKQAFREVSEAWTTGMLEHVSEEMPAVSLPSSCVPPVVRKAAKTEDKRMILMNSFLKSNIAFGASDTLMMKEVAFGENFAWYRNSGVQALAAAYFVTAREQHDQATRSNKSIGADFLLGDCSRVACQEVMLMHLWSNGRYTCAPLQVQPDSGVAGIEDLAKGVDAAQQEKFFATPSSKKRRTKLGKSSTYWQLLSFCRALLFLLPTTSMQAWMPGASGRWEDGEPCTDPATGHRFDWDSKRRRGKWCLPRELRMAGGKLRPPNRVSEIIRYYNFKNSELRPVVDPSESPLRHESSVANGDVRFGESFLESQSLQLQDTHSENVRMW